METKIYKLEMDSQNVSASKSGYFLTKEEVEKVIQKWEKIVDRHTDDYYGITTFKVIEIGVGEDCFD
jgi:hypothetical protein